MAVRFSRISTFLVLAGDLRAYHAELPLSGIDLSPFCFKEGFKRTEVHVPEDCKEGQSIIRRLYNLCAAPSHYQSRLYLIVDHSWSLFEVSGSSKYAEGCWRGGDNCMTNQKIEELANTVACRSGFTPNTLRKCSEHGPQSHFWR